MGRIQTTGNGHSHHFATSTQKSSTPPAITTSVVVQQPLRSTVSPGRPSPINGIESITAVNGSHPLGETPAQITSEGGNYALLTPGPEGFYNWDVNAVIYSSRNEGAGDVAWAYILDGRDAAAAPSNHMLLTVDFQAALDHEMGHMLGLRHNFQYGALMYRNIAPNINYTPTSMLHARSVDAMEYIYPPSYYFGLPGHEVCP